MSKHVDAIANRIEEGSQALASFAETLSAQEEELDNAAPVSLNADAPLTAQYVIEDHALRRSFHHLANIRAALGR